MNIYSNCCKQTQYAKSERRFNKRFIDKYLIYKIHLLFIK